MPQIIPGGDMAMARRMALKMRRADVMEVQRASGFGPLEGLEYSLNGSRNTFFFIHDGEVMAMGGCTPTPNDPLVGSPWLLGTDGIATHRRWVLQHTPDVWATVDKGYEWLWNVVDKQNTTHVKWLSWSGCTFIGERKINGYPFLEFIKQCASH